MHIFTACRHADDFAEVVTRSCHVQALITFDTISTSFLPPAHIYRTRLRFMIETASPVLIDIPPALPAECSRLPRWPTPMRALHC